MNPLGRPKKYTPEEAHQAILDSYRRFNAKPDRKSYQRHFERSVSQVERRRSHRLRTRFGITLTQYDEMLAKQHGVCAICFQPETTLYKRNGIEKAKPLSVDHDHVTGRVRGLLCFRCNAYLGFTEWCVRNPNWVTQAEKYLEILN
jgi:hypothetical protein